MRTAHIVTCASAVLLVTGALAAGCISNSGSAPDAGAPDAAGFDAFVPSDGGPLPVLDASDAQVDATASGALSTTTVDFGLVNCGTGTASQTYSFTNTGPVAITYSASTPTGSVFSIDGASSGSVAPGAMGSITLDVAAIPTTSTAGTPITGTLAVTTNVPGFTSVQVPLSVTPQGGSLTVSPVLAGFGQVQLATTGTPIPLTIGNVGNAPVTFTIGAATVVDAGTTDTEFGVTYPGSPAAITIAAGGSLGDAGATFAPTVAGVKSVTAALQTSDPLCASATSIAMSGTGTAAQVTVGPDPLPFGAIVCGQTGTKLQVTIKNSSPAAVSFNDALTLGGTSPFTIDITSGSVPGGTLANPGIKVINVTPKPITIPASVVPGAFNDSLVVTPTAPGLTATTISLQESAAGAILAVSMGTTAYGTVQNTSKALPFTVTNTGNRDAPLVLVPGGTGYTAAFTSAATAGADGGTATGNLTFVPSSNAADDGSITVTTTEALCKATTTLDVTATGAVPVAKYLATAISLASECGGGPGSAVGLSVMNNGDSPLTITSVASMNGYFTYVNPGTIQPGDSASITVTGAAIASGSGPTGGSTLSDMLSFTTNEVGSPTHQVVVNVGVNGANLSYVGGNTATVGPGCGDTTYTVQNTGNMTAYVTATGSYPEDPDTLGDTEVFDFDSDNFASSTQIAVGTPVSDTVIRGAVCGITTSPCTLVGTQAFSSSSSSSSVTSVGICVPLPVLNLGFDYSSCNDCC